MSKGEYTPENPSAFPSRVDEPMLGGGSYRNDRPGMTLRDYFAAHAPVTFAEALAACTGTMPALSDTDTRDFAWKVLASLRYEYADAMLLARKEASE